MLVEAVCGQQDLFWIERWLESLARTRSFPPSCYGEDAYSQLASLLTPADFLKVMEDLRTEFRKIHPTAPTEGEELSFLLDARANDPQCLLKEDEDD